MEASTCRADGQRVSDRDGRVAPATRLAEMLSVLDDSFC
jgi:hypothetical protein